MSRLRWVVGLWLLSLGALASQGLGQTVTFLDENGAATAVYAEGSRAIVRVEDPAANVSPGVDTVQVQLTSSRAGDAETLTLTETGPATGVFRGEIKLAAVPPGSSSQPGVLETAVNPDPPFERDTIQASYGAATATVTMAGSQVMFLDRYGRPTTHLVSGQPIRMRVIEPLVNFNPPYPDYAGVSLSTASGDNELLYLQETGADTGIFEGEIPSRAVSPVSGDQVLEEVAVGTTVTGEVPDFDVPTITRVTATLGADHVELVDAQGKAADFYLESSRVYVEVTAPAGSPSVQARVTADLSGDSEAVTLQETGAGTGVYRGSIAMRRGPALADNGLLETTETGPPYRFDTVRVTFGSTGSADAVQTIGSLTSFHDAFGNEVSAYAAGAPVMVRVEDHNFNNPAAIDSVQATVQSLGTGDAESLTLYETGRDTGLFEATVPSAANGAPSPNDGRLQVSPGETIQAMHVDAFPQLASGALARIDVLSIHFLDEKGQPTTELLEGGVVRVQVVSPSYNGMPHQVETVTVSLQARYAGDQETLQLTETGPDTGVFEGSLPSAFVYPPGASGDGTLQFSPSWPESNPEEVTATLGDATAVAHAVGSRLMFVDEYGRETTTVPLGGPVRLRVVGPAYNVYPNLRDSMDVQLTAPGDSEFVTVMETGLGTGIFEGTIDTAGGAQAANSGRLESAVGQTITATLWSSYAGPDVHSQAVLTGGQVTFVDETGGATSVYLEGTRARVQVVDHGADLHPSADTVAVRLTTEISGDQETLTLTETGPQTGVFEGSLQLRNGPVLQNSGAIEPGEEAGPPHAFDVIHASYTAANGGGSAAAAIGLLNFRVWFIDAYGQVTDRYAERSQTYVRVEDHRNDDPGAIDRTYAVVASATGDQEPLELVETGPATGIFEGSLPLDSSGSPVVDGRLLAGPGDAITAAPSTGYTAEPARARIGSLSVVFIDETGNPTVELLEGGLVRVRVVAASSNLDPNQAETLTVSLQTRYAGDQETLQLTETGPDTGVFEGTIQSAFAYPSTIPGDGTLQFATGGWPVNAPDEVTVVAGDATAVAHMVGGRIVFLDAQGRETTTVPLGSPVRVRVVGPAFNFDPGLQDYMEVELLVGGDDEYVPMNETGLDTGIFEGTIDSLEGSPIVRNGSLESAVGQTITARQYNAYSGGYFQKQAVFGSPSSAASIAFLNLRGQLVTTYSLRAPVNVRITDPGQAGNGPLTVALQSLANGDTETVSAVETSPGVFVGSLPSTDADGGASGDGTLTVGAEQVVEARYGTVTAQITFSSNRPPLAVDDAARTLKNRSINIFVMANDVDPEGMQLSLASVTQAAHGSVVINPEGSVTYKPAQDYSGTDTFTYLVVDPLGGESVGTVMVTLDNKDNSPPVAVDDHVNTSPGTRVSISPMVNDYDPDGDPITLSAQKPAHGTLNDLDTFVSYLPDPDFTGTDSFTYYIYDNWGGSATATVFITVAPNHPPVAHDDFARTDVRQPVILKVLANDTDPDGDPLSLLSVTQGAHGAVGIFDSGTLGYTPFPGFTGDDSFFYTVTDNRGGSMAATVRVTVGAGNHPPVANNDSGATNQGGAVIANVLANDVDQDGDPLTVTAADGVINPDQTVTFTPPPTATGLLPFSYTISDGHGGTATGTILVTIYALLRANDDTAMVAEDGTVRIDVLANDLDLSGSHPLRIASVTQGAHGTAVINPDQAVQYTPAANYNGSDAFTYNITDSAGAVGIATVTVTVTPVNDPPVANPDSATVEEEGSVDVAVLANDTDVEHDTLSVASVTQGAHGSVSINVNGTVRYAPSANYNGPDSFTYTVSDGQGGTATATVSITVTPVNDPPVASPDSATVAEDGTVDVPVLSNDSDPDNDPLTVASVTQGAHGTVAINANGTVRYAPAANYNGSDSFTYVVSDGHGGTATVTVTVAVTPVNDPPVAVADAATVFEDLPIDVAVLSNDTDPENDPLSVVSVTQGAHGTVTINTNGTVRYGGAPNYNGSDSFTYTVSDGHGGTATGTVSITVTPVDDPPAAVADTATVIEDGTIDIAVLANDTDVENDPLSLTSVTQGAHGTVSKNADGTVRYVPAADYFGRDSFTYTVSDNHGKTATGTVTVTVTPVNDPPVANPDFTTTYEDSPASEIPIMANDRDPDGDVLALSVTQPAHGTVVIDSIIRDSIRTVTYTPAPNYNGPDSFTYTITDGHGGSATATVSVTVLPVNDDPVAMDDSATVPEDGSVTIDVLANDSDLEGDPLKVTDYTSPAHGTLTLNADNTLTYRPAPNYHGADSFAYNITDSHFGFGHAQVFLTVTSVNDPPVAKPTSFTMPEDGTIDINVLQEDSDVDGDVLTVIAVTQGTHGAVAINPDKTVKYTPAADYNGPDSFTYTISDGHGATATATVSGNVFPVNDRPVANADTVTVPEDGTVSVTVLANDTDVDGDTLTVTAVTQGAHGAAVINPDKTVQYTPAANYNGPDAFTYTISDGHGGTATGTVAINVSSVDDAPIANADSASVAEDGTVAIPVLANDADPEGDVLTVTAVTQGAHGVVAINPDKTVRYTPAANYNGPDSFAYTVSDGNGGTATGTVAITVTPVDDPPVAVNDAATVVAGQGVTVAVLANDTDIDGPALAVTGVTQGAHGTVAINGDQTVTYTAGLYLGSDSFTYTVSDGAGGSSTATVTVNLTAPQRVATGIQARYDFNEGSGNTIADTSGVGAPLDITVGKPALVSWLSGGLAVNDGGAKIESSARATKIINAVQASNEITVEAWIQPASLTLTGPAGILEVSKNPSQGALLFGQSGGQYETQLKTSTGTPALQSPASSVSLNLAHVVYTRTSSGQATYYVNGVQVASQPAAGSLSVWGTDQTLVLANGWRGDYFLLAVYGRALTGAEVQQNYLAGVGGN